MRAEIKRYKRAQIIKEAKTYFLNMLSEVVPHPSGKTKIIIFKPQVKKGISEVKY